MSALSDRRPAFADRAAAGQELGRRLAAERFEFPCVVLALARGGVAVGAAVARALNAPLEPLLVRKIGAPGQPELAVGAMADGDEPVIVVDQAACVATGADAAYLARETAAAAAEIERRRRVYLRGRAPNDLTAATAIVVDDGIATGLTVRAALQAVRRRRPARVVLAVPVASREVLEDLRPLCDAIVCLVEPRLLGAVGLHYRDFHQLDDSAVIAAVEGSGPVPPR